MQYLDSLKQFNVLIPWESPPAPPPGGNSACGEAQVAILLVGGRSGGSACGEAVVAILVVGRP